MEQSSLHNARKLAQPVRIALEQLLGRTLGDNEVISVRAYQPHEVPSAQQQHALTVELRHHFARMDVKAKDIPESEQEEILDEAIRGVRPGLPAGGVRITLDSTILVRANQRVRATTALLPEVQDQGALVHPCRLSRGSHSLIRRSVHLFEMPRTFTFFRPQSVASLNAVQLDEPFLKRRSSFTSRIQPS